MFSCQNLSPASGSEASLPARRRSMNTRKDRLRSLFAGTGPDGAGEGAATSVPSAPAAPEASGRRSTSAAVKAMGLSLGNLSVEAQEARRLREALAAGETVVE